jgi:hypothetical protein
LGIAVFSVFIAPVCNGVGSPWWKDRRNLQAARHYAHVKGLLYRSDVVADNTAVNGPLTLQACDFPQELYDEIWELQPALNSLIDAASQDIGFLEEALQGYVDSSSAWHGQLWVVQKWTFIWAVVKLWSHTICSDRICLQCLLIINVQAAW